MKLGRNSKLEAQKRNTQLEAKDKGRYKLAITANTRYASAQHGRDTVTGRSRHDISAIVLIRRPGPPMHTRGDGHGTSASF